MLDFTSQLASFDTVANGDAQFFQANGLADEIVSATAQCCDRVVDHDVASDHYYDGLGAFFLDPTQHIEARAVRQINVEQDGRRQFSVELR